MGLSWSVGFSGLFVVSLSDFDLVAGFVLVVVDFGLVLAWSFFGGGLFAGVSFSLESRFRFREGVTDVVLFLKETWVNVDFSAFSGCDVCGAEILREKLGMYSCSVRFTSGSLGVSGVGSHDSIASTFCSSFLTMFICLVLWRFEADENEEEKAILVGGIPSGGSSKEKNVPQQESKISKKLSKIKFARWLVML